MKTIILKTGKLNSGKNKTEICWKWIWNSKLKLKLKVTLKVNVYTVKNWSHDEHIQAERPKVPQQTVHTKSAMRLSVWTQIAIASLTIHSVKGGRYLPFLGHWAGSKHTPAHRIMWATLLTMYSAICIRNQTTKMQGLLLVYTHFYSPETVVKREWNNYNT